MLALEFRNVSFRYSHDTNWILKDINLSLETGKTYALIGPTGQGKTTTANLIAGLYKPTSGLINFYQKSLESYSKEELYKKIGFILQEPYLFSGTIASNLIYGNPLFKHYLSENQITDKIKEQILDLLPKTELLSIFSDGLDTVVDNQSQNISLGQKQVINFLRAILRKPEFLILDEATANLDTYTESILQSILNLLPKETTKIVIAHRLNTVKNADQVFLVGGSKIKPKSIY